MEGRRAGIRRAGTPGGGPPGGNPPGGKPGGGPPGGICTPGGGPPGGKPGGGPPGGGPDRAAGPGRRLHPGGRATRWRLRLRGRARRRAGRGRSSAARCARRLRRAPRVRRSRRVRGSGWRASRWRAALTSISISVVPTRSAPLLVSVTGLVILSPFTKVPFIEPRSSTSTPRSTSRTTACRREISLSGTTRSTFSRPSTTSPSISSVRPCSGPEVTFSVRMNPRPTLVQPPRAGQPSERWS